MGEPEEAASALVAAQGVSRSRHVFANNFTVCSSWHDVVANATSEHDKRGQTLGVVANWTTSCHPQFLTKSLEKGRRKRDGDLLFEEAHTRRDPFLRSGRWREESDG